MEQGLGKFCDPDFVRYTSREMRDALNLTSQEMDEAAHQIMLQERSSTSGDNKRHSPSSKSPNRQNPYDDFSNKRL